MKLDLKYVELFQVRSGHVEKELILRRLLISCENVKNAFPTTTIAITTTTAETETCPIGDESNLEYKS